MFKFVLEALALYVFQHGFFCTTDLCDPYSIAGIDSCFHINCLSNLACLHLCVRIGLERRSHATTFFGRDHKENRWNTAVRWPSSLFTSLAKTRAVFFTSGSLSRLCCIPLGSLGPHLFWLVQKLGAMFPALAFQQRCC